MNGQIAVDATLDIGGRELQIFSPDRVDELKRLPLHNAVSTPML